jgi:hypothetical protein
MLSGLLAAVFAVAMTASAQSRPDAKPNAHPSPQEQTAIIDDVRNYALAYSQNLPDPRRPEGPAAPKKRSVDRGSRFVEQERKRISAVPQILV